MAAAGLLSGCPHVPVINPKPKPPRVKPSDPQPSLRPGPAQDAGGLVQPGDDVLRQEAQSDTGREVICFAYENFYDASTGEVRLPTQEEFARRAVAELAAEGTQLSYRLKASTLYDDLQQGDLASIAQELAC